MNVEGQDFTLEGEEKEKRNEREHQFDKLAVNNG